MKNTIISQIEERTMRRVTLRLLPFLMLCYFIAFIDRVNVGFAAFQMNADIGLSASAFGFGGGLFYISYVLLEVPSNLALQKFGARFWIARIMISWGIASACMIFVAGPHSYYALRLLLGAAEAGFFPGVVLYLTYWFPAAYRARIIAIFMVAVPLSSFLGSPLSAALLGLDHWLGLRGWQWMFVIEAVPAVVLGILTPFVLPKDPASAKWLQGDQREWLLQRLHAEKTTTHAVGHLGFFQIIRNKYVLIAALVYAGASGASQCLSLWQPQIIKEFGLSNMQSGLLNSIPFGVASLLMLVWGRHSDRTKERIWHVAIPLALIFTGLALMPVTHALLPTILFLVITVTATYLVKGPFWALATEWLSAGSAAVGIAVINSIGNVAGFASSSLLGVIKDSTGSYALGLIPLAALSLVGAVTVLIIGKGPGRTPALEAES